MNNSVDIDVGGTFTDMVLNYNGETIIKKTPTTPYDLSKCFLGVIEEGAHHFNLELDELLPQIDLVRYSTTVAMNRLVERKGPRLGLITTEGHEDMILIGKGAQWVDGTRVTERRNLPAQKKPMPLIPRDLIVGAKERVDSSGKVLRSLVEEDVREKVQYLVDKGVRGFVISLLWSQLNSTHEEQIRDIIRQEYKDYHIGSLPIVLASQVSGRSGEYQRTMTAVLDAYLFRSLQIELSAMWDQLREYKYRGPFMMVHNSGGMAEVFKTDAIRTYSGGPVAGLIGASYMADKLGYKNVIQCDVGGTTFDIGLVVEQNARNYDSRPMLDRWMVGITMLQTMSIGAGGGSIAWINKVAGNRLEVGPKSAGSYPGPVCYDQGGEEPTTTDADLVLGYLDPDFYFGGRMILNKKKAEEAIRTQIAEPLGVSVIEAALLIRRIVGSNMEGAIRKEIHLRGYDPKDFILFANGGGGPTHVTSYLGDISKAVVFPFSPVFSAMGTSCMDVMHVYEQSRRYLLMEPMTGTYNKNYSEFNEIVQHLIEKSKIELMGEGISPDNVIFRLELEMLYGGQVHRKRSSSPLLFANSDEDFQKIYEAFEKEFSESFSPLVVHKEGGVFVENFVLSAIVTTSKAKVPVYEVGLTDSSTAVKGHRTCHWNNAEPVSTPIFGWEMLTPGNIVMGPAIIETEYTSIVLEPSYRIQIDKHGFGIIEKK